MSTEKRALRVAGLKVEVVRKNIKHLHLGVYPPDGRVRVSAPLVVGDEAVRLAVVDKLSWIRQQQARFADQARQSPRELVAGESHYVFGRRCRLRVRETEGRARVAMNGVATLDLFCRPDATPAQREAALARWYRGELRTTIGPLVEKWSAKLGVAPSAWGVKRMKTRWGTCTPSSQRIWFNTELAKKPILCIEYIVVHELLHCLDPTHGAKFISMMDKQFPRWPSLKKLLNAAPLAHDDWDA